MSMKMSPFAGSLAAVINDCMAIFKGFIGYIVGLMIGMVMGFLGPMNQYEGDYEWHDKTITVATVCYRYFIEIESRCLKEIHMIITPDRLHMECFCGSEKAKLHRKVYNVEVD